MALQGDLDSFALPDVLRLLAGTAKTGRLEVTSSATNGEMWLLEGDLVGGQVDVAPHAARAADVVFELIRLDDGSFVFEEGERLVDGGERCPVDEAIGAAQDLVSEWAEVEAVVPTVQAPVRLVAEIDGDSVTVAAAQWRVLAAIGDATTVGSLGNRFELTDLVASRQVKDLIESGLAELGEMPAEDQNHDDAGTTMADTDDAGDDDPEPAAEADLSILRADDRPVLLEDGDDADLPEPLPDAGTTFDVDLDHLGTVDGRSFESFEVPTPPAEPAAAEVAPDQFSPDEVASDETWASFDQPPSVVGAVEDGAVEDGAVEDEATDEDRDSLMRFLSTVEP